jgi:ABC-type uncharacterized transport system permease subunit
VVGRPSMRNRISGTGQRRALLLGVSAFVGAIVFVGLPILTKAWWPFTDQYDRLHSGVFLALFAAVAVWWLFAKTTLGFSLRMVGANPNAARYAGVNITRNIVTAMAMSGALAGIAGTIEILGAVMALTALPLRCWRKTIPLALSPGPSYSARCATGPI